MIKASVKASIDHFLSVHHSHRSLDLRFGLCRIRLLTNSKTLKEKLRRYFGTFVRDNDNADIEIYAIDADPPAIPYPLTIKQPDPGKMKIKEEFRHFADGLLVRKRLTGMVFLFGNGANLAIGPCLENDNQVVNFIINRFIQWILNQGALLLHAAGVSLSGAGLAVSGFSGMGKSTLALHIMNRGTRFVSNDRLMVKRVDGRLRMIGVPKLPRINPGTILGNQRLKPIIPTDRQQVYRNLSSNELWSLEEKYDAYIDDLYGPGSFELEADLKGLVVLNWNRNQSGLDTCRIGLAERTDLIPAFAKDPGLFYEPDDHVIETDFSDQAYLNLLADCPVYEFSGGLDFDRAADICCDLLKNGT